MNGDVSGCLGDGDLTLMISSMVQYPQKEHRATETQVKTSLNLYPEYINYFNFTWAIEHPVIYLPCGIFTYRVYPGYFQVVCLLPQTKCTLGILVLPIPDRKLPGKFVFYLQNAPPQEYLRY